MRHNVEIGQKKGEVSGGKTLAATRSSPTGCRPGTSTRSRSAVSTGTNELSTDPSNISAAVQEFLHPDVEAPQRRPRRRWGGSCKLEERPSPKSISVVVLNGNGKPGAAANTSYLLGQKGYRVLGPPQGFQANAPKRVFRTQIYYNGKAKATTCGGAGLGPLQLVRREAAAEEPGPADPRQRREGAGRRRPDVHGPAHADPGRPHPGAAGAVRAGRQGGHAPGRAPGGRVEGRLPAPDPDGARTDVDAQHRDPVPGIQARRREDRSLHVRKERERVLGHPGGEVGRCAGARRQEPQRSDQGPAVRPLLQRAAPAHGRPERRRRELLGREHAHSTRCRTRRCSRSPRASSRSTSRLGA